MAKSVYFYNCIRAIRQAVFGRDNRKPIADAIKEAKDQGHHISSLGEVLVKSEVERMSADSWVEIIPTVIHDCYSADTVNSDLDAEQISGDDYRITDSRSTDNISLISDDDYLFNVSSNYWSGSLMEDRSYTTYERIVHYETFRLVLHIHGE